MQRLQVLKHNFTGETTNTQLVNGAADVIVNSYTEIPGSKLNLSNNYYSYTSEVGGGAVNDNNVRDFLNDEKNVDISMKFISYLQIETTNEEFKEIFYNNKKLASVFNEYYKNNILNGNDNLAIDNALWETNSVFTSDFSFDEFNNRQITNKYVLNQNSDDFNYYVPIYVEKYLKLIDKADYSEYFKDCFSETYIYKKYSWINNIITNVIFGNSTYINNRKGPEFGTIKIYDFSPFNNLTKQFEAALVTGGRGNGGNGNSFDYNFTSFSEFKKYFNYSTPEFTTSYPGLFITQDVIYINNNFTFNNQDYAYENYSYGEVTEPLFNARFSTTNAIEWDKSSGNIVIPIKIELNSATTNDVTYIIKAENYSTATLGTDFEINNTSPGTNTHNIIISQGQKSYSFGMELKQNYTKEESAVLSLRNSTGETIGFLVIKLEETIEINTYNNQSYLLIEDEKKFKIMLKCFVDLNYNDNENEKWRNNNIAIINNSSSTTTVSPNTSFPTELNRIANNQNAIIIRNIAELIKTPESNIINLYRYGSDIYGTKNAGSDIDFILILNNFKIGYKNFIQGNVNIQIYSQSEFLKKFNNNEFPIIETAFYPKNFIIKQSVVFKLILNKERVKNSAISYAIKDYNLAKRSIIQGKKSNYYVKKTLFHAFRMLIFALELIKKNTISDLTIAMPYYNFIFKHEFNSSDDVDTILKARFDILVSDVKKT